MTVDVNYCLCHHVLENSSFSNISSWVVAERKDFVKKKIYIYVYFALYEYLRNQYKVMFSLLAKDGTCRGVNGSQKYHWWLLYLLTESQTSFSKLGEHYWIYPSFNLVLNHFFCVNSRLTFFWLTSQPSLIFKPQLSDEAWKKNCSFFFFLQEILCFIILLLSTFLMK